MDVPDDMPEFSRREYALGGLVVVLAVALAASLLLQTGVVQGPSPKQEDKRNGSFEQYADANEQTGTTKVGDVEVVATITVMENGIAPASVTIETGKAVRWVNQRPFPVRLEFDRTPQTPVLEPGGEVEMRFRGITYYQVYNDDTGERIGRGRINVQ